MKVVTKMLRIKWMTKNFAPAAHVFQVIPTSKIIAVEESGYNAWNLKPGNIPHVVENAPSEPVFAKPVYKRYY